MAIADKRTEKKISNIPKTFEILRLNFILRPTTPAFNPEPCTLQQEVGCTIALSPDILIYHAMKSIVKK
jgi:hypothetical protein